MKAPTTTVSIIVPFYKGNQYLNRLLASINCVAEHVSNVATFEVIIVNDSPTVDIELPVIENLIFKVNVQINPQNIGIHGSRVGGLKNAKSEWVLFLDQDDELVPDGFVKQLQLTNEADVVVGNGLYQFGEREVPIYKNYSSMKYLIQKQRFMEIRNLIPSPGECLIRKTAIPGYWKDSHLNHNGSDDWLLWLLLFNENVKFACNYEYVYIHNDAGGNNLSFDLKKMHDSSLEMCEMLNGYGKFSDKELEKLRHAVEFKFYQDTKQLSVGKLIKYFDAFKANVLYKLMLATCR